MSVTTSFQSGLFDLLSQRSTTTELYLKPINTVVFQDSTGNTVATSGDVNVTYSNGVVSVTCEFNADVTDTIATALIGNTYQGVFTAYFQVTNINTSVTQGNLYSFSATVTLSDLTLVNSPYSTAKLNANKLVDIIGSILSGDPLHTGKTGQFFDAIYVVNTVSNVSQSFRIPITIATINPTLLIGGITPSPVIGNQIILRDSNQNDLVTVSSTSPIKIKKGRQIVFEFTF